MRQSIGANEVFELYSAALDRGDLDAMTALIQTISGSKERASTGSASRSFSPR
jgi:hypothetical protein